MKSIEPCCTDERVVLARRGALGPQEWQDFASHLVECVDCRIAWKLNADFDRSAAAQPGDERIVARGVQQTLVARARGRKPLVRFAVAASVTLVAAGVASGAMVWRAHRSATAGLDPASSEPRAAKARRMAGSHSSPVGASEPASNPVAPSAECRPLLEPQPVAGARALPTVPRLPALPATRHAQKIASVGPRVAEPSPLLTPPPHPDGPAALLAEAMVDRQQGRVQYAIAAFRALQRRFPDSGEATVGLVSLGDLLFEGGGAADALAAFENYLLRAPAGTLAPEALWGKARALARLGRAAEASEVRREIMRRFPDSPYAQQLLGPRPGGTTP